MKLFRYVGQMLQRLPTDDRLKKLHELLLPLRVRGTFSPDSRIVVQCVQDPFYLALFSHLSQSICKRATIQVELFVCRSFEAAIGTGWKKWLLRSFPLNRLQSDQWVRLWHVVATRVAYRSTSFHPLGDLIDAWKSWRLWRRLETPADLDSVTIDGITCGDLVIDSYLRFRPSPRVQLDDPFLLHVLWQAHRDVRRAKHYFHAAKPLLYLTSYTTYVQHGIAVRVALQEGTRVISFGNLQEFGKQLTLHDSYQTRNVLNYKIDFELLENPDILLKQAQSQLDIRLKGGIDSATSYMAISAYRENTKAVPDAHNAVIIFLHDFYDSPHVYADFIFTDFWEWICFTLDTLHATGIRYLVKPHPNQIALSDSVIDELIARYPGLELVEPGVTNRQLVDAGMACAVTVYGTVAHEMAYMGVPSIACARHPHVAFDFCRTAHDRTSYADLLHDALAPVGNRESLREQALQFYVMHNLSISKNQIELRDALIESWKVSLNPLKNITDLVDSFDTLATLSGFEVFIDELLHGLNIPTELKNIRNIKIENIS